MVNRTRIDLMLISATKQATVNTNGHRTYTIGDTSIITCNKYMGIMTNNGLQEIVYATLQSFQVIDEDNIIRIRYDMTMMDSIIAHNYLIMDKE